MRSLNQAVPKFEALGVKLLSIASDKEENLKQFVVTNQFQFPIIADEDTKLIKSYGVYTFGRAIDVLYRKVRIAVPSKFLINAAGKVAWNYIGARNDRPPVPMIIAKIREHLYAPEPTQE